MGPEAASELEPAGAWKGFLSAWCHRLLWEGSAAASSAPGGRQLGVAGLGTVPSLPCLGWTCPCGRMAPPGQAVLSPRVGACPQAPCLWGNISQALPGVLCSGSCAPVPGENWDSCSSGCCLSTSAWSWRACQLEKLDNCCSWCPLEMGKGSPSWVLSCLPSAGLLPE